VTVARQTAKAPSGPAVNLVRWEQTADQVMGRVGDRFGWVEPRRTPRTYVARLLSATERNNCCWLAKNTDHAHPDATQRLLRTACRDAYTPRTSKPPPSGACGVPTIDQLPHHVAPVRS
jgi:hypothetical protein